MVRNKDQPDLPAKSCRVKITPYSQIINICVFIPVALLNLNPIVLAFQALLLLTSIPLFHMSLEGFRGRYLLYLIPLILFIIITNSFRGGGEIILRAGPFLLMKQGVFRGLYYSTMILELYMMSSYLTRSFSEQMLVSTLYTIGIALQRNRSKEERRGDDVAVQFALMLYYILRLFHGTYAELKVIFDRKGSSRQGYSLKRQTIVFVHRVFKTAVEDYARTENMQLIKIVPRVHDLVFVVLQITLLAAACFIRNVAPLNAASPF
jgi:energy-coupling factor transporter transmembrane protein EcfT